MIMGRAARVALALAGLACGSAAAAPARSSEEPPASLLSSGAVHGAAVDPVLALVKVERLRCAFSEEKHIALLARPLRSTGTIYFARDRGIARTTLTPRRQQVVLTPTALRIYQDKRTEEIPLARSKDLKAFALIFPTLLRGERGELARAFEIGLHGKATDWWALAFTPRTDSLRALVRSVVVFGRNTEVVSLRVVEASGDTTDTRFTEIRKNGEVADAELATAFEAPVGAAAGNPVEHPAGTSAGHSIENPAGKR